MSGYGYFPMMGYYGHGWGGMGWMMVFGGIFWLALLILAVVFIVWLVRGSGRQGTGSVTEQRSAGLEILEERYARSEISREEYLQKKADIQGRSGR